NLDNLLIQGAKKEQANPANKMKYRAEARTAYAKLNQQFGQELKLLVRGKGGYSNSMHPLINTRQGWKIANRRARKGRSMPLLNHPDMRKLTRVMGSAKWLGRGVLVVDLVSRGHNVLTSQNRTLEFFREATGYAFSAGSALAVYGFGASMSLILGPWGLVLIIIAAGVGAVIGDTIGKGIFDLVDSSIRGMTPLLVP
ncbi:hypothetical protein JYT31_03265, partial [Beggiatoa alba]|nr:hypothetical protein [Beggiatoa alba]